MYDEMSFLELFGTDAFISVNKHLAKEIGLVEACLFGEMLSKYKYYKSTNELKENKWFYLTIETIEESIGLKKDWQNTAIKNLEKLGLIEKKRMGLPAKRYFSVNVQLLMSLYLKKGVESPSLSDFAQTANLNEVKPQTRKSSNRKLDDAQTATIKKSNKNDLEKEFKNTTTTSNRNKIDNELKEQFPNVDYELAKEQALEQFEIKTDKQYYACVLMKLNDLAKPKKKKAPSIRKEMLPSWLNEEEEKIEEKPQNDMTPEQFEIEKAKLFGRIKNYKEQTTTN